MNHVELSDLVHTAANHIRERADHCSTFAGPWRFDPSDNWPTVGHLRTADDDPHGLIAEFLPSADCGPYVAAMNPQVGRLVATLLEHIADDIHDDRGSEREFPNNVAAHRRQVVDGYCSVRHDWTAAVALARSVLDTAAVTA